MAIDRTIFDLRLRETNKGRHYWATSSSVPTSARLHASSADILITPWEERSETGPSFPDGTTEFFTHLQKELEGLSVAILSDEENYTETALHADKLRLPSVFLNKVALPVFVGVILIFIDNQLEAKSDEPVVEFEVVVEGEHHDCISIRYEGPPNRLAETLISEVERCFPESEPPKTKPVEDVDKK